MAVRLAAIGFQHQHIFSLIDGLLRQPGVELGGIAEPDEALRAAAAARYGVTAYADHRDLLAGEEIAVAALAPINREKPGIVADCAAAGMSRSAQPDSQRASGSLNSTKFVQEGEQVLLLGGRQRDEGAP